MQLPESYYAGLARDYQQRRDVLCGALAETGFRFRVPDGAYYVLCETHAVDPDGDDVELARRLVSEIGVAAVPGSSFHPDPAKGRHTIRFAFPKRLETLQSAAERLAKLGTGTVSR
jgi:aminotransferase